MKILLIAPEPVFEESASCSSIHRRILVLTALGHTVDLVACPGGTEKDIPGLTVFRCRELPRTKSTGNGALSGFFLFLKTVQRLFRADYDLLCTVGRAGRIGWFCQKMTKIPHLHDIAPSLSPGGDGDARELEQVAEALEKSGCAAAQAAGSQR